jgi:hypothetical protein
VYYLNKTRWLDLGITDDAAGTPVTERSLSQRRSTEGRRLALAGDNHPSAPSYWPRPSVSLHPSEEDEDEKEKEWSYSLSPQKKLMANLSLRLPQACSEL